MEGKPERNQLNLPHVQSIIIRKVRVKTEPENQAKRSKRTHTYTVENSPYRITNQDVHTNAASNTNPVQCIPDLKTEERMDDEDHDINYELKEQLLFPELCLTNNIMFNTTYDENAKKEVQFNESEELIDENCQSTLFNVSDIPSKSIQAHGQAGTNSNTVHTASDSTVNREIECGTNFESERNLENHILPTPNYAHQEIPLKYSVVNDETIFGIICEQNSEIQPNFDEDNLNLSGQLKIYVKKLKLHFDILNFTTESLIKGKFKYDDKQFCLKNHNSGHNCQSVSDCLKKQHYETNNYWLESSNPTQAWCIITFVLKNPDTPPHSFFFRIIDWLYKKTDITKIMWIAKYLANLEKFKSLETEYSQVWSYILKALLCMGVKQWSAISILLHLCHEIDFPQIAIRIIFSIKLEQVTFPNYWKCFQLLVEQKFQLPHVILTKILESFCNRRLFIRGNDEFIIDIAAQVCEIRETDFPGIKNLIENFLKHYEPLLPCALKIKLKTMILAKKATVVSEKHVIKKIRYLSLDAAKANELNDNNYVPSESAPETNVDNVLMSLQQAIESQDTVVIAKILVLNCNAPSSTKIGKKFYYLMQYQEHIGTEAGNIMKEINRITCNKAEKLLFAKLCIDLMFFLAYNDKWTEAYVVLSLVRQMKHNPVTLKPVVRSVTSVCRALTCSQVLLNSHHYNSAINVIINNRLHYEDQTKWLVEGDKNEFILVKNTISTLFLKFLDTKMISFALKLFKEVINVQESLFAPMNIFSIFESMLKQMLMNFDTDKDLAMDLFLTVYELNELNEEIQLSKVAYRLLIICAMRKHVNHIVQDLVSLAIASNAYPIKQSKKNTITLTTDLLEEEMMAYIINWCAWFYNKIIINEPRSSKHHVNISIELIELNNKKDLNDEELPDILKSVDSSLTVALLRMNSAILKVANNPNTFGEILFNSNPINLSAAASQKLISSVFQFLANKKANQSEKAV